MVENYKTDGTPQPLTPAEIGSIAYEANRAYRTACNEDPGLPWDEAPDWQRAAIVKGVLNYQDNPLLTPEQSHERWLAEYEGNGWVWGPVKDGDKKEHPCILPYSQLPVFQRRKDTLFRSIVLALHANG